MGTRALWVIGSKVDRVYFQTKLERRGNGYGECKSAWDGLLSQLPVTGWSASGGMHKMRKKCINEMKNISRVEFFREEADSPLCGSIIVWDPTDMPIPYDRR